MLIGIGIGTLLLFAILLEGFWSLTDGVGVLGEKEAEALFVTLLQTVFVLQQDLKGAGSNPSPD